MAESDDITARDANAAAEIMADVGIEQIADIYGRALLGAAENAGRVEEVIEEFAALVSDVLDRSPSFEAVLAATLIPHEEKVGIIDRVFAGRCSPLLVDFLKVASRHGRLDCLRAIGRQMRLLHDKSRGRVHVHLTTAEAVDDDVAERIAQRFREVAGGEPILRRTTDPDLIGGAVLRIGDTVYDGSIANQLELIRQQMIDRSAHEIQGRRDRFRDPAGD